MLRHGRKSTGKYSESKVWHWQIFMRYSINYSPKNVMDIRQCNPGYTIWCQTTLKQSVNKGYILAMIQTNGYCEFDRQNLMKLSGSAILMLWNLGK